MLDFLRKLFATRRTPRLCVVSAPSGAGKTSLVKALLERDANLRLSVSFTTRPRRSSEVNGQDYIFIDAAAFAQLVADGEMLESAEVFGNHYGSGRQQVERLLAAGHDVMLEIDWQGARQVREALPDCRSIFVLPPSRAELERRLRNRATDTDEVIARRLGESVEDMTRWQEFDYVVVNDDFDAAVDALARIVGGRGAPWRRERPEIVATVKSILA